MKYTVYLGSCETYDADAVASVIGKALEKIRPQKPVTGRIVIKPNLCFTHPRITSSSFTEKEVVEGFLKLLPKLGSGITKVDIVEKSGLGVTTANMFRWAGYRQLRRRYGVGLRAMEEGPKVRVLLEKGKLHRSITVAREMAERDFLIFMPKLKTNVLSHGYTGALKLNIGTVDSKERIDHHDMNLPGKIVDILEAANPDLIITDGIKFSFGGNQMTQHCTDMGVLAVSANAVAHDMVCAKLIGLDPFQIGHIREAMDRGYGPVSFKEIEITGDFPMERARPVVSGLDFGFRPVETFPCHFRILSGEPLCIGGCQGIFLDWLHMIKDRKPRLLRRFPKITAVVGAVREPVEDKTVLLLGDCARATQTIRARRIVRIRGCPPTHKRIIWDMMTRFFLLAPLVRPSLIIDGFVLYPLKRFKGWLVNLRYRPLRQ